MATDHRELGLSAADTVLPSRRRAQARCGRHLGRADQERFTRAHCPIVPAAAAGRGEGSESAFRKVERKGRWRRSSGRRSAKKWHDCAVPTGPG